MRWAFSRSPPFELRISTIGVRDLRLRKSSRSLIRSGAKFCFCFVGYGYRFGWPVEKARLRGGFLVDYGGRFDLQWVGVGCGVIVGGLWGGSRWWWWVLVDSGGVGGGLCLLFITNKNKNNNNN